MIPTGSEAPRLLPEDDEDEPRPRTPGEDRLVRVRTPDEAGGRPKTPKTPEEEERERKRRELVAGVDYWTRPATPESRPATPSSRPGPRPLYTSAPADDPPPVILSRRRRTL